ncbi:MmgE/PrpD family protein [Geodermatophilus sp. DSM 44513]|uniref:MmgE/PrpD family protein n=1 Tax=Geodermatophilus sp. DSM 44513 TaxID=1528104 RepID=UPI0028F6E533|nr:MmgE/PrpD family protein [Geodermatophilus sp. DSM 44513]WNV76180.1 MmgE/PrpD family protein [Geodermatophilus sp. DSM 44513]
MTPLRSRPGAPVEGLAAAVSTTSWAACPGAVRDRVVDLVADCVAVTALGSRRPELSRVVAGYAAHTPDGPATVVGRSRGWPAATAAFLNGCAVAADQLQDGHRPARGHPAAHVVPAVLALGEEVDATGGEVLSAVLAGYEAGVRLGRAMGGTPPGVHDIGTWGQVAASAAAARLLAPGDAAAARRALELSAAAVLLTDAGTVFGGAPGGHAFLGASVQLGTTLGAAAVAGLAARPGALDRHLAAVAAQDWDPVHLGVAPDGGWDRHEVLAGYVKAHPTCAHLHGVNDAVADLLDDGVRGADVASVEVRTWAGAAGLDSPAEDELSARFSIPTSVAVALVHGRLDETTMTSAVVTSPAVRDLAARVRVVHDATLDAGYPAGRPASVRLTLADGGTRTAAAARPRGDADRAFSRAELAAKAERLLVARFGTAGRSVLAAVHALADGGDARTVGAALRRAAVRGEPGPW